MVAQAPQRLHAEGWMGGCYGLLRQLLALSLPSEPADIPASSRKRGLNGNQTGCLLALGSKLVDSEATTPSTTTAPATAGRWGSARMG